MLPTSKRSLVALAAMATLAASRDCYVEDVQEKKSGLLNWKAVPSCQALFIPRLPSRMRDRGILAIVAELQRVGDKKSKLEELDLAGNSIGPKGARALAGWLNVSTKMRAIELRGNPLGDEGVSELAYAIGNSLTVNVLGLAQTDVSDAGAAALAAALGKSTSLSALEVSNNYIGAAGGKALADAITSNGDLRLTRYTIERNLGDPSPDVEDTARVQAHIKRMKQRSARRPDEL